MIAMTRKRRTTLTSTTTTRTTTTRATGGLGDSVQSLNPNADQFGAAFGFNPSCECDVWILL